MEELTLAPMEEGKYSHAEGRRIDAALGRGEVKDGILFEKEQSSEFKAAEQRSREAVLVAEQELSDLRARQIEGRHEVSAQEIMAAEANLESVRAEHRKKFLN